MSHKQTHEMLKKTATDRMTKAAQKMQRGSGHRKEAGHSGNRFARSRCVEKSRADTVALAKTAKRGRKWWWLKTQRLEVERLVC